MKILVSIKRVIDHTLHIRLSEDARTGKKIVDSTNMKMVMNPFDEVAVEEAVHWKEKGLASEVVVVSVGSSPVADTLRTALAMGADRALHVKTDELLYPLSIAKILKEIVKREQPKLVFLGRQAVDDDCAQTGPMLAGLLNWGQGTFASHLEMSGNEIMVTREIDGGKEVISLPIPAVITADLLLNSPRYASLPNIMKAKKKPLEELFLEELAYNDDSRINLQTYNEPLLRKSGMRVSSLEELVLQLRQKEILS